MENINQVETCVVCQCPSPTPTSRSFLGERDQAEEGRSEVGGKLEVSDNETINVFSIASGHLYERFLRCVQFVVQTSSQMLYTRHLTLLSPSGL